ncbi:hypothetical protein PMIN02_006591 [Paraphaeosphaeria minitans]
MSNAEKSQHHDLDAGVNNKKFGKLLHLGPAESLSSAQDGPNSSWQHECDQPRTTMTQVPLLAVKGTSSNHLRLMVMKRGYFSVIQSASHPAGLCLTPLN